MNIINKPDIVQMFDCYEDRTYYKVTTGFLGYYKESMRVDTVNNSVELHIKSKTMPDKVIFNEEEYKLIKIT